MAIPLSETNIKVFLIVAMAVLLAVGVFFTESVKSGGSAFDLERAYQSGCQTLLNVYGCRSDEAALKNIVITDFSLGDKKNPTFYDICMEKFAGDAQSRISACVRTCGCNV